MYYFVFVITHHDVLKSHVVQGDDRASLERTRSLVISGAQVSELHFVSPVMDRDETHQERSDPRV